MNFNLTEPTAPCVELGVKRDPLSELPQKTVTGGPVCSAFFLVEGEFHAKLPDPSAKNVQDKAVLVLKAKLRPIFLEKDSHDPILVQQLEVGNDHPDN